MSSVKPFSCPPTAESGRPPFNQQHTQDRLREATRSPPMIGNLKKNRKSAFREVGLVSDEVAVSIVNQAALLDESQSVSPITPTPTPLNATTRGENPLTVQSPDTQDAATGHENRGSEQHATQQVPEGSTTSSEPSSPQSPTEKTPWYAKLATGRRARVRTGSSAPPSPIQGLPTMTMLVLAVALVAPLVGRSDRDPASIVDAGPIHHRADSPTDVCARWAQQSECDLHWLYLFS